MGSITGLKKGAFTSIDNSGEIRLGNNIDSGTIGQALISGGEGKPAEWGSHSGTIQPLTAGSHVTFSSGNATFDGSIADTINTTAGGGLSGGDGIDIVGATIQTDNDEITISNSTSLNRVLRVPNDLTISQNGTTIDTFDGSANKTIDLVDTTYTAGNGIQISGSNIIQTKTDNQTIRDSGGGSGNNLQVIKVPNTLTFTGYDTGTFDGSSALSINLVDKDTTYQGGTGISIDTSTNPDTINCNSIPNTALQNSTISGKALGDNLSTLTFYNSVGGFLTSYNGADPPTSITLDGDTTYTGGKNITVDTTTNPDEIDLDDDLTDIDSITFTSGTGATAITGNDYPSNPTTATYLDLSSSSNVFPNFVGGSEILKSMSFIDNTVQNRVRIYNTANRFVFDGSSNDIGSDSLEIDFTATSTHGYCEFGFYANSLTSGMIFYIGIAAATGGTSPFSTSLGSGAVSIDAYKLGLLDGSTSYYSLRELLDFTGFENTYLTSKYYFNNLSVGTRYRMALYGRCYNSGSIFIHSGGRSTSGLATGGRNFFQPAFMKFYEYDNSIGGNRVVGSSGGGSGK